jgi:preprotein translocase subunit SecA
MSVVTLPPLTRLPEGVDAFLHGLTGRWRRRKRNAHDLHQDAQTCLRACEALHGVDTPALYAQIQLYGEALRRDPYEARGQLLNVLGAVGQMSARSLGKQPYVVQFMGALAIHRGWLAEMATGEGKTLTVALAGILAGLSGRPCHVVTANDYLAVRDAEEMRALYEACGVSLASIAADHEPEQRMQSYAADVVYVTAKDLLADYLRDQLAARSGRGQTHVAFARWMGQPDAAEASPLLQCLGLHTAIVDEAVTPLILAAPRSLPGMQEAILWAEQLAGHLVVGRDYHADSRTRSVVLLEGTRHLSQAHAHRLSAQWQPLARREELIRNALTVRCFIHQGHQYVIEDGEVVLLDEFTGRMTPGRTLTAGLHQAIEAHEGLELTDPNESLGQLSFQSFFRRFRRLSGTTGTAKEAAHELWRIYRLGVLPVPTHRPRQTVVAPPVLLDTLDQKWSEVVLEVQKVHAQERPVLVGVRSVESSERVHQMLKMCGLQVSVLNALQHAEEARIVARAGEPGRITIATNMAGRGTDIRLSQDAKNLGGLHVVIAECNESARIDRQLAGRCGRQGDPGSVALFLSLQDPLLKRYLPQLLLQALKKLSLRTSSVGHALVTYLLTFAQTKAEADAFNRRWAVLQADDWKESALPFQNEQAA